MFRPSSSSDQSEYKQYNRASAHSVREPTSLYKNALDTQAYEAELSSQLLNTNKSYGIQVKPDRTLFSQFGTSTKTTSACQKLTGASKDQVYS
jgi:hypothetical protein